MFVGGEFIAQAIDRADIIRSAGAGNFPPEVLYVLVDKIEIGQIVSVVAPEMCGNGLTGQHPVLIDEEVQQQVELFPGGVQGDIADTCFESVRVQADLVELHEMGPAQVLSPVDSPDACVELGEMEGFCQIVVGAVLQADDLIVEGVAGGNDEDIALFVFGPDLLQQVDPVAIRQADVQQDTVILKKAQLFTGNLQVAGQLADIAFFGQEVVDVTGQLLVIFYDQDFHDVKLGGFSQRYPAACK